MDVTRNGCRSHRHTHTHVTRIGLSIFIDLFLQWFYNCHVNEVKVGEPESTSSRVTDGWHFNSVYLRVSILIWLWFPPQAMAGRICSMSVIKTDLLALYLYWQVFLHVRRCHRLQEEAQETVIKHSAPTYLLLLRQSLRVYANDSKAIMWNRYVWIISLPKVIQMDPVRRCRWSLRRRSGKFCSAQTRKTTNASVLNMESQTSVGC